MNEYQAWRQWMRQQTRRNDGIGDLARLERRAHPDYRWTRSGLSEITTVFGFMRWMRDGNILDRDTAQWLSIAYAEWQSARPAAVRPRLRFLVFKRDGYACRLCGRSARDGAVLEVDHITARARGGTNDVSNLWTLCWACNRGKRDDEL